MGHVCIFVNDEEEQYCMYRIVHVSVRNNDLMLRIC
jgi:hypothetical protein